MSPRNATKRAFCVKFGHSEILIITFDYIISSKKAPEYPSVGGLILYYAFAQKLIQIFNYLILEKEQKKCLKKKEL